MCKNICGHQSDESWLKGRGARKSPHLIEHRAAQRPCIRLSKVIFTRKSCRAIVVDSKKENMEIESESLSIFVTLTGHIW